MRPLRYPADLLATPPLRTRLAEVAADPGLVLEDEASGFVGAVVATDAAAATLEDRHGRRRDYPYGSLLLLEGRPVRLGRPVRARAPGTGRTASGSVAAAPARARVARHSRIYVEGRQDADLVEKVWGDDLRDVGVIVEHLGGVDDLAAVVDAFRPGPGRRLGVLVDHLVAGSKESRLAAQVASPHVLVVGHPYVDVWQAVRPATLGIEQWPVVPPGTPWKEGVCAGLGWPADPAAAWRTILARVRDFTDLEPALLGRVEELIDFVTAADPGPTG